MYSEFSGLIRNSQLTTTPAISTALPAPASHLQGSARRVRKQRLVMAVKSGGVPACTNFVSAIVGCCLRTPDRGLMTDQSIDATEVQLADP